MGVGEKNGDADANTRRFGAARPPNKEMRAIALCYIIVEHIHDANIYISTRGMICYYGFTITHCGDGDGCAGRPMSNCRLPLLVCRIFAFCQVVRTTMEDARERARTQNTFIDYVPTVYTYFRRNEFVTISATHSHSISRAFVRSTFALSSWRNL